MLSSSRPHVSGTANRTKKSVMILNTPYIANVLESPTALIKDKNVSETTKLAMPEKSVATATPRPDTKGKHFRYENPGDCTETKGETSNIAHQAGDRDNTQRRAHDSLVAQRECQREQSNCHSRDADIQQRLASYPIDQDNPNDRG